MMYCIDGMSCARLCNFAKLVEFACYLASMCTATEIFFRWMLNWPPLMHAKWGGELCVPIHVGCQFIEPPVGLYLSPVCFSLLINCCQFQNRYQLPLEIVELRWLDHHWWWYIRSRGLQKVYQICMNQLYTLSCVLINTTDSGSLIGGSFAIIF